MSIAETELVSAVVERDIDLVVVQLIETAPAFRRWLFERLGLDAAPDGYLGVRHSETRDSGESDIEFGFETPGGESHIVLVENKIDAAFQDRQAERYFERGETYIRTAGWDDYSVVLIAPERYVGQGERERFGSVLLYEELVDAIDSLDHDGKSYFRDLFRQATATRASRIDSYWTGELERRFEAAGASLPPVGVYQTSNKHLRVESHDPAHPHDVLYNVFFPSTFDGEKAVIRLNLTGRSSSSMSPEAFDRLRPLLETQLGELADFESRDRRMEPIKRVVWRQEFPTDEAYIDAVFDALGTLIETYHPVLVSQLTTARIVDQGGNATDVTVYGIAETEGRPTAATDQSAYWVLYGLDPSETELLPPGSVCHTLPDLYTGEGMDELIVGLLPQDQGISIKYE